MDLHEPDSEGPRGLGAAETAVADTPSPDVVAPEGLLARITAWDHAFLRTVAAWELSPRAALPLVFMVRIGDGWMWALAAGLLWWALPFSELKLVVAHCLLAIAVSLAIYWPVKLATRRPRPHDSGLGIRAKVPPLDKFSFPSGHTMNNLAVALTLAHYVPGLLPAAVAVPLVLGCLRVYFGVHYLSDIVGGAVLGAVSFVLALQAMSAFAG